MVDSRRPLPADSHDDSVLGLSAGRVATIVGTTVERSANGRDLAVFGRYWDCPVKTRSLGRIGSAFGLRRW